MKRFPVTKQEEACEARNSPCRFYLRKAGKTSAVFPGKWAGHANINSEKVEKTSREVRRSPYGGRRSTRAPGKLSSQLANTRDSLYFYKRQYLNVVDVRLLNLNCDFQMT
ncbi:hypothetical protein EVAR_48298_1 [Eumeta japonica]|uniref:Uncharacterized protein n=1 Tax=Eumeta variegata TaxID=151549 RepID=A0A4C1WNH8_EUMVA|nr:hypothetical protein EVAR_48298_1 [Eumeta japonica]